MNNSGYTNIRIMCTLLRLKAKGVRTRHYYQVIASACDANNL